VNKTLDKLRALIYRIPNRSLKALLLGYVLFKINDRYFLTYNSAHKSKVTVQTMSHTSVKFSGWNIFLLSWRCFFLAVVPPGTIELFSDVGCTKAEVADANNTSE
jgi:hypothetical protein